MVAIFLGGDGDPMPCLAYCVLTLLRANLVDPSVGCAGLIA